MKKAISYIYAAVPLALWLGLTAGCQYERSSMWELKCAACHDGKTILEGKVVMDKEQLKQKYPDIGSFINSCASGPECMNILKHDKRLFGDVGREIGIPEKAAK